MMTLWLRFVVLFWPSASCTLSPSSINSRSISHTSDSKAERCDIMPLLQDDSDGAGSNLGFGAILRDADLFVITHFLVLAGVTVECSLCVVCRFPSEDAFEDDMDAVRSKADFGCLLKKLYSEKTLCLEAVRNMISDTLGKRRIGLHYTFCSSFFSPYLCLGRGLPFVEHTE